MSMTMTPTMMTEHSDTTQELPMTITLETTISPNISTLNEKIKETTERPKKNKTTRRHNPKISNKKPKKKHAESEDASVVLIAENTE